MRHRDWIVAAAFSVATTAIAAPAIHRCGNTYSPQPCEGGGTVGAPHLPTREEAARAAQAAKVDAQRADALEKARLAREKNAPKAIVMGPKQSASAAKAKPTPPLRKPETFTAKGPAAAKR
ncbi:hypothetical protein WG902_07545 [Ramlibacter sp. PS3R-8]|uniref:hypothetical protein n=1 Tax=Ramlibacter sp. PS3R-8 TaxID=3133437 RepID=UPI0030AB568D